YQSHSRFSNSALSRFPPDQQLYLCFVFPDFSEPFSLSQFRAIALSCLKVRDLIASVLEDFIGSRFQLQFRDQTRLSDKSNIHTRTAQDNQSTVLRVSIVWSEDPTEALNRAEARECWRPTQGPETRSKTRACFPPHPGDQMNITPR
ncbi:hypothetical protein ACFVDI_13110, partial [Nocardioides sp. NPDC057767]|uniref:hypothetical protein n=1 Tax=Nocardioides sp. NPDC057767 TaxID=3346244 RepID=UPI0036725B46